MRGMFARLSRQRFTLAADPSVKAAIGKSPNSSQFDVVCIVAADG
jgi:hypothetical protein